MSRDRRAVIMNKIIPVDREWINIAAKIQLLECGSASNMQQVYDDALLLQDIAAYTSNWFPRYCQTCLEPTDNAVEVVRDFIDVIYGTGPILEATYHCYICGNEVAYFAHGYYEPRY